VLVYKNQINVYHAHFSLICE